MPDHTATRPTWTCRICAEPWPCAPARLALRAELGETQLRIYGWTMLENAVGDLPELTAPELFQRFMLWTRMSADAPRPPNRLAANRVDTPQTSPLPYTGTQATPTTDSPGAPRPPCRS